MEGPIIAAQEFVFELAAARTTPEEWAQTRGLDRDELDQVIFNWARTFAKNPDLHVVGLAGSMFQMGYEAAALRYGGERPEG
jgi:hypothetical protein